MSRYLNPAKLKLSGRSSLSLPSLAMSLLLLLSACTSGRAPTVTLFGSDASAITAGEQTRLYWQGLDTGSQVGKAVFDSDSGVSMTVEPGVGDVTGRDFVRVSPNQTTTYTLTVSSAAGRNSYQTTITVTPAEKPGPGTPPPAPGNKAPTANPQEPSTPEDTALSITLSGSDDDGDSLTYSVVPGSGPTKGTLTGTEPNLTYTPAPNYNGPDSFSFKANDGDDDSTPATVSITVTAVNDAPSGLSLSSSAVAENAPAGTEVGTLSATDPDPGDTTFTYSLVTGTGDTDNAKFEIQGDALATKESFDFETQSSYSVLIEVSDGRGGTLQKSFTIAVTDGDDAPAVSISDPGQLTVGAPVTLSGTASDDVSVSKVELYEGSTLLGEATLSGGTWTYNYTPSAAGTYTLKAVASDAVDNSAEAAVEVTVTTAQPPPPPCAAQYWFC